MAKRLFPRQRSIRRTAGGSPHQAAAERVQAEGLGARSPNSAASGRKRLSLESEPLILRLELARPQLGAVILRRCAESTAAAEIIFLPFLGARLRSRHLQPVIECLTAVGPG